MSIKTENYDFKASDHCKSFHQAIAGIGSNKTKVTEILTSISNKQRIEMKEKYKFMYNREISEAIKSERTISGDYRDALLALLYQPHEFDAISLHDSLNLFLSQKSAFLEVIKNRTNVKIQPIIEIISTRTFEDLIKIQEFYKSDYKRSLDTDIKRLKKFDKFEYKNQILTYIFKGSIFLSHPFVKLIRSIIGQKKLDNDIVDETKAMNDAKLLIDSESSSFSFENELIRIFTEHHYPQLKKILDEYQKSTGKELNEKLITNNDLDAQFKEILLNLIDCARDIPAYFAKKLHEFIEYTYGPKDHSIIRVIVSRSEIDLNLIKKRYKEFYNRSLKEAVKSKINGNFQSLLISLIGDDIELPTFLINSIPKNCDPNPNSETLSTSRFSLISSSSSLSSVHMQIDDTGSYTTSTPTEPVRRPDFLNTSIFKRNFSEANKPNEIIKLLTPNTPENKIIVTKQDDNLATMLEEITERLNKLESCNKLQQDKISELSDDQEERLKLIELLKNTTDKVKEKQTVTTNSQIIEENKNFYTVKMQIDRNDLSLKGITINSNQKIESKVKPDL